MKETFLSAEWRHLALLNYTVEPTVLEPYVPAGTMLDTYQGQAYVSLVGFLFLNTKIWGLPVPLHQNFEEVNLRFYVRRFSGEEWRRGVVFIKEIVPRPAIAAVARAFYNENYIALSMRHSLRSGAEDGSTAVEYAWEFNQRWNHLRLRTADVAHSAEPGSLEEFITEHYWGYAKQKDGGSLEYRVEHPPWLVQHASEAALDCDAATLYGDAFAHALRGSPSSAFLAAGSTVTVAKGVRI